MKHPDLDSFAADAAQRYSHFLSHLGVIRHSGILSTQGIDGVLQQSYTAGVSRLNTYAMTEREILSTAIATVSKYALEQQGLFQAVWANESTQDALAALLSASHDYLLNTLVAQGSRDLARMRASMQSVILHAGHRQRLRVMSDRAARIEAMMSLPEERFVFTDRLGRDILSETFVRNVARQVMLSAHNEATLLGLSAAGYARASVLKPDTSGALIEVAKLSIDGLGGLPNYLDVRDELFHPNSRAFVAKELQDVSS